MQPKERFRSMSRLSDLEDNIPVLRRYAWSLLRNSSDADDLVQDCLVRALDRIDTYNSAGDMRPWLFAIMHNLFVSRWRRTKTRAEVTVEENDADAAVPAQQAINMETQDVLRGLAQLPPEQQQVLLLVSVEGLEYSEVAAVLGIPIGTVMSRLSRGRDRLRDFMEGRQRPMLRRVK
jgi:RNA polymerase sigma-70 factor (ECF subfamily)